MDSLFDPLVLPNVTNDQIMVNYQFNNSKKFYIVNLHIIRKLYMFLQTEYIDPMNSIVFSHAVTCIGHGSSCIYLF